MLAASSLAARAPRAEEIVPPPPQMVMLTITGINGATNVGALGAVMSTLIVRGMPVNLVIHADDPAALISATSEIGQLLRNYAQSFPGLVEIVAWSHDLGRMTPYRAARRAHEARRSLFAALFPAELATKLARPVQTIACRAPLDSNAASAVLAAGFRCVLQLPEPTGEFRVSPGAVMTARLDKLGVLSLIGGESLGITEAAGTLTRPKAGLQRHLVLDAAGLAALPTDQAREAAQDIARLLSRATLDLTLLPLLASDVQMRSEVTFRRRIALHVIEPEEGDLATAKEATAALLKLLTRQGIPFSRGAVPKSFAASGGEGLAYWVPLELPADRAFDPDIAFGSFPDEQIGLAGPGAVGADDPRFGVVVRPSRDSGNVGLTQDAELIVPILSLVGAEMSAGDIRQNLDLWMPGDGLVLIRAATFLDAATRSALVGAIRKALVQPDVRLMSLSAYCAEVLPKEPLLPMLLLARARGLRPTRNEARPDADEREALLQDAQAAWGYFAGNTNSSTGLCPATAGTNDGPKADFLAVSMWEVGSHLNALMAVADMGILSDKEFSSRVARILRTVDRASRKRLVLPPETIDALSGKGTTRFNSFDTGRLLIALYRLASHRLAPEGIAKLVASWDFASVIRNRRVHSYRERRLIDDFRSNYAHYAVAGMRLWGFDVASPLDQDLGLETADSQERLLGLTSSFGVLGAEPSFLHLLEMPGSAPAGFLADCVDAIQRRLARETGKVAAPSETPLDRSPWFTYQGFDLRRLDDPWRVEFGARTADAAWEGKIGALKATSTKAAYLWHALRPSGDSRELIHILRTKARTDLGFDSALYDGIQKSTRGYSDLNTNAVILQAVAHMLRPQ